MLGDVRIRPIGLRRRPWAAEADILADVSKELARGFVRLRSLVRKASLEQVQQGQLCID